MATWSIAWRSRSSAAWWLFTVVRQHDIRLSSVSTTRGSSCTDRERGRCRARFANSSRRRGDRQGDSDRADDLAEPRGELGVLAVVDRHVDDRRAANRQRLVQNRPELPSRAHPVPPGPEGVSERDEVGIREGGAWGATEACLRLPLRQVEGVVVEDDVDDG